MARFLDDLRASSGRPTPKAPTTPTEKALVSVVGNVGDLAATPSPNTPTGQPPPNADTEAVGPASAYVDLEHRLEDAVDWIRLGQAVEQVDGACRASLVTPEQAAELAEYAIRLARILPEDASVERLSQALRATPMMRVASAVLGEVILFAADAAVVDDGNTLAVYRESELRHLVGCSPGQLRAVHVARQLFDGVVVAVAPGEEPRQARGGDAYACASISIGPRCSQQQGPW